jgi:hypothetical protein
LDVSASRIAPLLQGGDFVHQLLALCDPAIQALAAQHADLRTCS